jgi:hypothetical protein
MACAPRAARGFFPLDDELRLLPGPLSPYLHHSVVRLGAWVPFEQVPTGLDHFTGVTVSVDTARRLTEGAGAALVAWEAAELTRLEQEGPAGPPGPAVQQVSVDGAMVPLVHGEWAEVKTLAIGTVARAAGAEPRVQALSYYSRLTDAATFCRLGRLECHRRGTATAGTVLGICDGAEWCQHCLDWYCPQAVRILDFPHAAEHLSRAAQAVFGAGTAALSEWLGPQLHTLKHGDPDTVLAALRTLPGAPAAEPGAAAVRDEVVAYLTKRRAQIAYAEFRAAGYPIGSGVVESANKLVVEARLKGSGMHWARANVNPMVALRAAVCSDRWADAWAAIGEQRRRAARARRQARAARKTPPGLPRSPTPVPPPRSQRRERAAVARLRSGQVVAGRPTRTHPWNQPFFRRRTAQPRDAKS